jgi:hypothetical protein
MGFFASNAAELLYRVGLNPLSCAWALHPGGKGIINSFEKALNAMPGVSATGLEFFFCEAPGEAKSVVLALFFLTTFAGDLLNGVLYSAAGGLGVGALMVGLRPPVAPDGIERAAAAAAHADVAVVVIGMDQSWEGEGGNRADLSLPGRQAELVAAVSAANPRTVVLLNSGAVVSLDGTEAAPALVQTWYLGEEHGNAVADVLTGAIDPGGRLPMTWGRNVEDWSSHEGYPGADGKVTYGEGLLVGYRDFDAHDRDPAFCFGHGLSYGTSTWGDVSGLPESADAATLEAGIEIRVPLHNDGDRPVTEVVQCYVGAPGEFPGRPLRELRSFSKVRLDPGERSDAVLRLDRRSFSRWDPSSESWSVMAGAHTVQLGRSSRDLLVELLAGHDLDVPAAELAGEPDVLAAAADRQGELILADEHDATAEHLAEDDFVHLGRLQGVGDEHLEVVVPADDVDPLAAELLDDVLDAVAADADAGTDAVDPVVGTDHRHLAAVAGLAGDRPDLDHPVGDLGDLLLEQPLHELRADPREDDLHPAADLADLEDRAPDPLVGVVRLAGDLLAPRQDRLLRADLNRGGGPLEAGYHARHHLADLLLELVVDGVALGFTDLLDDHLLGRLGADPAGEFRGVERLAVVRAGDLAVLAVDLDRDDGRLAELPRQGRDQRGLDRLEHDLLVDVLVAVDRVDDAEDFFGLHGVLGCQP